MRICIVLDYLTNVRNYQDTAKDTSLIKWPTRSSSSMSADTSAKAPGAKSLTPSLRELL